VYNVSLISIVGKAEAKPVYKKHFWLFDLHLTPLGMRFPQLSPMIS